MYPHAEAWRMNNNAHLYLLQHLSGRYLGDQYAPQTRPVASQFAHIHNVRFRWLTRAAPEMADEIAQFARGANLGKDELIEALGESVEVMARFLKQAEMEGRVHRWEGSLSSFLAYFVSRETHHRSLALAALEVSGHLPPSEVMDGLWDWSGK
jgi:uncharacterized damage-inducible protein DinB